MPDTTPIRRFVYRSRSLIAGNESAVGAEITHILNSSLRNNAKFEVTGALLMSGGRFVQVLEGPHDGVGEIYARIVADPRHTDLEIMEDGPVHRRMFADWWMAYAGETAEQDVPLTLKLAVKQYTAIQGWMIGRLRFYLFDRR